MTLRPSRCIGTCAYLGLAAVIWLSRPAAPRAQPSPAAGEWPTYAADNSATHYSPLAQVDASNFGSLEVAWRVKTDTLGPRPEYKLEGTPLMVGGVLDTTAGTRRAVVALDAQTGEVIWSHSEREGARSAASPRQLSGRGVAYWTDGRDERILYVTIGFRLVALDAKTGSVVSSFGTSGAVDLKAGVVFRASVGIDAFPGRTLEATVESLAGGTGSRFSLIPPDNASGNFVKVEQRVPVRLAWTAEPGVALKAGLSADLTVFVGDSK